MVRDDQQSRRAVLRLGGTAAVTALLAGCSDAGPGGNGSEENETGGANGEENETEAGNETEGNETEAGNETEGNETEAGNESEDGNESEGGGGGDAIEPGTIGLGGETQGWQGAIPDAISGEENPTLTLQEGESYEITWENMDGVGHNLQIRDDSGEVVDDYETEIMDEEGETQTLEIDEVTSEMAQYVCEPHQGTMNGDIEVQ